MLTETVAPRGTPRPSPTSRPAFATNHTCDHPYNASAHHVYPLGGASPTPPIGARSPATARNQTQPTLETFRSPAGNRPGSFRLSGCRRQGPRLLGRTETTGRRLASKTSRKECKSTDAGPADLAWPVTKRGLGSLPGRAEGRIRRAAQQKRARSPPPQPSRHQRKPATLRDLEGEPPPRPICTYSLSCAALSVFPVETLTGLETPPRTHAQFQQARRSPKSTLRFLRNTGDEVGCAQGDAQNRALPTRAAEGFRCLLR